MKRRIHIKTSPVNIQKLIKSIGIGSASISLGVTPSALGKYIRSGSAPKATELAAQSLLGSNNNQEATLIMRGSPDLIATLKAVASMGGGKYAVI